MWQRNELSDCLEVNGLRNLVKNPTCFKSTPSLIDLIITNEPKRFKSAVCADTGLSDFHSLVCNATKIQVPKLKPVTFRCRAYKHFEKDNFLHDVSLIPYHVTCMFDDIDDPYWLWNELTMQVINEHAPLKTRTVKGRIVPYMNGELRRAINVKNMLKRKYDKVNNKTNWDKYRLQRNLVTKLRKKSINIYLQNKCNSQSKFGNSKEFWDTVKPLISRKISSKNDSIILMKDDEIFSHPEVVASVFNDYFINIAKNIGNDDSISDTDNVMTCLIKHANHNSVKNIRKLMHSKELQEEFDFHQVTIDTIRSHLNKLKAGKATGYDMLPSKLLKTGSEFLSHSICSLVNMSFQLSSFPSYLKYAEVSPIHKKGSDLDVSHYRPVSILSSMPKIFEKEKVAQLSLYFEDIFNPFLSGFRSQHSCETVLLRMTENIKQCPDEGKILFVLIRDLSRAFDSIPFKLLISKLHAYGLSSSACELLLSYYSDRKQRVKVGNHVSNWQNIYKGSAQGSIIGPISYNIFSNDMFLLLDDSIQAYNYTDDNSLLSSVYDYEETQQNLLKNV